MGSLPNCASYCHKYQFANEICRRGRSNEMIQCSTVADVPLKILPRFEKGEPRSKLEHFKLFSVHLNVSNSWPEVDWRSLHVKFPPPSCWRGRAIVGFSSTTLPASSTGPRERVLCRRAERTSLQPSEAS